MRSLLKKAEGIESRYGKLLLYFVMIPFLYPRGFAECWPWYKTLFTLWLYVGLGVAAVWIVYDVLSRGLHYKKAAYWIVGYHILFVAITLLTQKGIHEGLQKMLHGAVRAFLHPSVSHAVQRGGGSPHSDNGQRAKRPHHTDKQGIQQKGQPPSQGAVGRNKMHNNQFPLAAVPLR